MLSDNDVLFSMCTYMVIAVLSKQKSKVLRNVSLSSLVSNLLIQIVL